MVQVIENEKHLLFEIQGWHKLWSFQSKIKVRPDQIVRAYQNESEIKFWKGFRCPGTEIPGIIAAGTFYQNGRHFWDVSNKSNCILIELQEHYFKKLFIDVENPQHTLSLLNNYIQQVRT